ncbi:MAG: hypothetical protein HW416_74 [Chloroflexi bacterium]|nr:hypothetical protein [Chloroflexota bacterium]
MNPELAKLYDDCLADVKAGRKTVAECLADHPTWADELKAFLSIALAIRMPRVPVDQDRKLAARVRFIEALHKESQPRPSRLTTLARWLAPVARPGFAAVILAVLIVAVTGTSTVLAAQGSIPGDVLYPVKTTLEQVQVAIAPTPQRKARLHVEFARKRLAEAEAAAISGRDDAAQIAMRGYADAMAQANAEVESAPGGPEMTPLVQEIQGNVLRAEEVQSRAQERKRTGNEPQAPAFGPPTRSPEALAGAAASVDPPSSPMAVSGGGFVPGTPTIATDGLVQPTALLSEAQPLIAIPPGTATSTRNDRDDTQPGTARATQTPRPVTVTPSPTRPATATASPTRPAPSLIPTASPTITRQAVVIPLALTIRPASPTAVGDDDADTDDRSGGPADRATVRDDLGDGDDSGTGVRQDDPRRDLLPTSVRAATPTPTPRPNSTPDAASRGALASTVETPRESDNRRWNDDDNETDERRTLDTVGALTATPPRTPSPTSTRTITTTPGRSGNGNDRAGPRVTLPDLRDLFRRGRTSSPLF